MRTPAMMHNTYAAASWTATMLLECLEYVVMFSGKHSSKAGLAAQVLSRQHAWRQVQNPAFPIRPKAG